MNARYLLAILVILVAMALSLTSRSTLTPERGADHVFYGPTLQGGAFAGQELAIGDFNGDGLGDFASAIGWDDPDCGGWNYQSWSQTSACINGWTTFTAVLGPDTVRVCRFADPAHAPHWAEWVCLGWDSIPGSEAPCAPCSTAEYGAESNGAVYVFKGGDWSTKPHDTDLTVAGAGGADHLILGGVSHANIYNGMAAGDLDEDGRDELALGAPDVENGAVYILRGAVSWPSVIDLGDSTDIANHVAHYLIGRDAGDGFGEGLAVGDLDGDERADIVVAARRGGGPESDPRTNGGEVYIFYAASLPDTVDLSGMSDTVLAASEHVSIVYGPAANSYTGVTHLYSCHPVHPGRDEPHQGHYSPVGLAIGDWDGDGRNDLAIGGGQVAGGTNGLVPGDGAVYVIFGRPSGASNKLQPGRVIDLANGPSLTTVSAPDVRIAGKTLSALGAGVAFVDADGQGLRDPETNPDAKADLIMGAPEANDERGEVYLIFGDTRGNLTASGLDDRSMSNPTHYDVKISGESVANESCGSVNHGYGDQLGGHFSGNLDFDGDGKNDVGISGQEENYVFFIESGADWPDSLDLTTVHETHPELRVVEFVGTRPASSSTIRYLNLDNLGGADLVFGGYDIENRSDAPHAGQMWIWKGSDVWKSGLIEDDATWSGNVFVHGDITVAPGQTLTI